MLLSIQKQTGKTIMKLSKRNEVHFEKNLNIEKFAQEDENQKLEWKMPNLKNKKKIISHGKLTTTTLFSFEHLSQTQ